MSKVPFYSVMAVVVVGLIVLGGYLGHLEGAS
jgi:hypothetical protein